MMRTETRRKLEGLARDHHSALPAPVETAGFATECFIASLKPADTGKWDRATLERIAGKAEVARRLFQSYLADLSRPASQEIVRDAFAQYLAIFYLHAGYELGDWKWINTAVKMADGIVLEPAFEVPETLQETIAEILVEGSA